MKIISFIYEANVIRKIPEHLELWEEKITLERASPVSNSGRKSEPYDDGWSQYENPSVTVH